MGRSVFEPTDDPRDLVLARVPHWSCIARVGEGNGVMSSIAAIWGEEITEPGESDPAEEWRCARILGARRGKFDDEILWRRRPSDSTEYDEPDRRDMGKSVLI